MMIMAGIIVILFLLGAAIMFCVAVLMLLDGEILEGAISIVICFMLAGAVVFVPLLRHAVESM
jgi:membrane protein YdbS with pleckstrin-like domain